MRDYTEIAKIEEVAEDIISHWADCKLSYDYLTEMRMIGLGDTTEFTGSKGNFKLNTESKFIDVDSAILSDLTPLDKGVVIGSLFIGAIEKEIENIIKVSNLSGKLADMKGIVKIVIDNSVLITEDNKACLKYGVAAIY